MTAVSLRRGFTLVELLVIIGIMSAMVTVSVMSVRAGQGMARIRGATRDIFATIRQARSIALVSQQPAVITYSMGSVEGEPSAKIEIHTTRIIDTNAGRSVETLSGESVRMGGDGGTDDGGSGGESIEEVLFAPMREDVVKGIRIKVLVGDETLATDAGEVRAKSKLSVFSNVDYLIGKFTEAKKAADDRKREEESAAAGDAPEPPPDDADDSPKSVVWEVNGRCEPHRVWVYADGARPEDGMCISIDRFGAAKVLSEEDR